MTVRRLFISIISLAFLAQYAILAQDPSGRDVPKPSPKKEAPAPTKKVTKPASTSESTTTSKPKATPTPAPQVKNTDSPSAAGKSSGTSRTPATSSPAASTERARLILTAPSGSDIEFNGKKYTIDRSGKLTIDDIPTGRHQMTVSAAEFEPWKGTVTVTAPVTGFTAPVRTREATGRITVFINEPGTELFIDGNSQGVKSVAGQPITISGLKQGNHEVLAVREGFEDWKSNVPVSAGLSKTLNIAMRIRLNLEMAPIESGEFMMGDDKGPKSSKPAHTVVLGTFEIMKSEVTNRLYKAFLDETSRSAPLGPGWRDRELLGGYELKPVVYVSWEDAQAFARWISQKAEKEYRLPTEAEWERAMRAAGNQIDSVGRVWEWCADWYDQNYYKKGERMNPKGPQKGQRIKVQGKEGEARVIRGGEFKQSNLDDNVAVREGWVATRGRADIGFRLVRDIKP